MNRHTADSITDDALDALYDEITQLRHEKRHLDGERPATVTDPAYLRQQYAAALYDRERPPRDPAWPDAYAMDREVFEAMADAVLRVRDRHLDQLRQRLELADVALRGYTEAESADAAAGSYARRAEDAEAAVRRVTALYERWNQTSPPLGTSMTGYFQWWREHLDELHAAIRPGT